VFVGWFYLLGKAFKRLGPEEKFLLIRLVCHESYLGDKPLPATPKDRAEVLGVSLRTLQSLERVLKDEGILPKRIGLLDKVKSKGRYQFGEGLDKFIEKGKESPNMGNVNPKNMATVQRLLVDDEYVKKNGLERTAVRLWLMVLVAYSNENGVVSGVSIAGFNKLLGKFTKDRHRSQLSLLTKKKIITGYKSGFTGRILFGKVKSQYVLNGKHLLLSIGGYSRCHIVALKENANRNLLAFRMVQYLAIAQSYDEELKKEESHPLLRELAMYCDGPELTMHCDGPELEVQRWSKKNKIHQAFAVLRECLVGKAFACHLQQYIMNTAIRVLRDLGKSNVSLTAVLRYIDYNDLFSKAFIDSATKEVFGDARVSNEQRVATMGQLFRDCMQNAVCDEGEAWKVRFREIVYSAGLVVGCGICVTSSNWCDGDFVPLSNQGDVDITRVGQVCVCDDAMFIFFR